MKVTKFRGQVNDQTFDNVQDYNKAITEAIEKNNLKSASSNTWVEEFVETKTSDLDLPTPTLVNGTMEELKKTFEYYIDDELEKLTQALDEFCDDVSRYSDELQVLDNQLEDKLNTYKKLAEEINKLEQDQPDEKPIEEPIEPQKEPQKPSWMSNSHYNFLKEIFG